MQTHDDKDQFTLMQRELTKEEFLDRLAARADRMREAKQSTITAGTEDEPLLAQWKAHGMTVNIRPDDPQGILRISVGGGSKTPVPLNYCVVRGDISACIDLLERAIRALKAGPE